MPVPRHVFVVLAYGESSYLEECLRSLRAQTRPGSGIAIATSTPSTFLAAAAARHGATLAVNPHRVDIATDWNFALATSDADLITLAHQDDVYDPRYAGLLTAAFERNAGALLAFCDAAEHTPTGQRRPNLNVRVKQRLCARAFGTRDYTDDPAAKRRLLAWGNPVNCPSVMFDRRKLADFHFDAAFASNLDWDAWTRIAQMPGGFAYVRAPLVGHRVHPASETSALIADRRRQDEDRRIFARFWPGPVAAVIAWVYRLSYRSNRV